MRVLVATLSDHSDLYKHSMARRGVPLAKRRRRRICVRRATARPHRRRRGLVREEALPQLGRRYRRVEVPYVVQHTLDEQAAAVA